jgi:hypothetical protein
MPLLIVCGAATAASLPRYYAYPTVLDRYGVIAPWYQGQNGQADFRVRIAAETMKRYPWVAATRAPSPAPEYIYSGAWQIAPDGAITVPPIPDSANGDLGQRAAYVLGGLIDYYRYSGDPVAIAHITIQANVLLDHCLTPADHLWPSFLISVPIRGKPYGQADPRGWIQLDIVAEVGVQLLRAAQLTGDPRWLAAARHWGDLLAEKRCREPGLPPWPRYANPEQVPWEDHATGGIAFILEFFDALVRSGYTGRDNSLVEARNAGAAYLRDVLLPNWTGPDTWGRNYWDWPCPVQVENVTEFVARYLMEHPAEFPNWRCDARNIMTLFLNRTSVAPGSGGDVFSGAWAYPESSGCCGRSLWYGPLELVNVYAQYGVLAESEWSREMARRQLILATYDGRETGVVEDGIDGGPIVAGDWFKIAHPMALRHVLAAMGWMPEVFGAARENHILRSSSVVTNVVYGKGRIAYTSCDAPPDSVDVLRLAFRPRAVSADGRPLNLRPDGRENGYRLQDLPCGDCVVTLRHDGARSITLEGDDPQAEISGDDVHLAAGAETTKTLTFQGNQVRLIGDVGPDGGLAEVSLDDMRQLVGIDCWNPTPRERQVLYYRSGLGNGPHTLAVKVKGAGNPYSKGTNVRIDALQYSAATGTSGFGEGGGPTETQRWIFGYPARSDYVGCTGNTWRPATEFVVRSGPEVDSVAAAWWTRRTRLHINGTADPELYRYGVHGPDFWANFTVGPGTYHVRLKFAETRNVDPKARAMAIQINGQKVVSALDIAATAAQAAKTAASSEPLAAPPGRNRAVDLVFNDIAPDSGIISIRFTGCPGAEAMVQAIEVGPGDGGQGATPVELPPPPAPPPKAPAGADGNLLRNGGFEDGAAGEIGSLGRKAGGFGWTYIFAGAGQAYVWPESGFDVHPDWGSPAFHSGKEALRTHTDGQSHTLVYQDAEVAPETPYVASVWVRADDLHGKGFGTNSSDSAGLRIQELDASGAVIADHPKQSVTKAGDYAKLAFAFASGKATTRVRFITDTIIACHYQEGHVTYDDCYLGPVQPPPAKE